MFRIPIYCSPESPENFAELLGTLTFGQMCGVISFFVVFITMTVLACKGKLPFEHKVEDFIEEAKRNGTVVNGHRTSLLMRDTGDGDHDLIKDRQYTGVYEFEIDGKKKKTSIVLLGVDPPLDVNVYYSRKNGRLKIMTDYQRRTSLKNVLIIMFPLIVAVAVSISLDSIGG